RDLAVTAVDIDDRALPARLWNGAELHVVSGARILRRWFTRPQLGGCLNPNKTRSSDASSIDFSRVERRASALRTAGLSGTGGAEMNNKGAKTRSRTASPAKPPWYPKPATAPSRSLTLDSRLWTQDSFESSAQPEMPSAASTPSLPVVNCARPQMDIDKHGWKPTT